MGSDAASKSITEAPRILSCETSGFHLDELISIALDEANASKHFVSRITPLQASLSLAHDDSAAHKQNRWLLYEDLASFCHDLMSITDQPQSEM